MEGAEEELKRISVSDWSSECHPGTCQPRGDHWLGSSPKQRHQLLWVKLMQSCQPSIAHPHRQPPDKSPLISANTGKAPVNKRNNRTSRCLTPLRKPSSLTKSMRSPGPVLPPHQMRSYTAFHHHSCLYGSPQHLPAHYNKDSQGQLGFIKAAISSFVLLWLHSFLKAAEHWRFCGVWKPCQH